MHRRCQSLLVEGSRDDDAEAFVAIDGHAVAVPEICQNGATRDLIPPDDTTLESAFHLRACAGT
jgi:hypothetical protein